MPRLPNKLPLGRPGVGAARSGGGGAGDPSTPDRPGGPQGATRGRLVMGAVAVIVVVLVVLISSSGGQVTTPPATGATSVVPGDALAYVHFSTDDSRSTVRSALELAGRFPGYPRVRDELLAKLGAIRPGVAVDFNADIRPWLGKEAALALLDTGGPKPGELIVLDVRRRSGAQRFLASATSTGSNTYGGTAVTQYRREESAFLGHYLVIGADAGVRAAIDVAHGRAPSLGADSAYQRATASEPAGRVVDAYVTAAGLKLLLASRAGLVGAVGTLLSQPTLEGIAVALTPASGGVEVALRSVLNPQVAEPRAASFAPSLASSVPSGTTLMLDLTGLDKLLPRVLGTTGIGGRIPELLRRLGAALTAEGIDVRRNIVSLFQGESAVVIRTHGTTPVLTVIARTPDPSVTRTAFAELEGPLEQLFAPAGAAAGQAPLFNQVTVGGVTAHQLVLAPGIQFDYAIFGGDLVLSTSLAGIASIAHHPLSLVDEPAYRTALGTHPARVTSLLFLELNQLLSIGEQTGLIAGAGFRALKPDLERVHAIGLDSTSGEAESTAELFLQIS